MLVDAAKYGDVEIPVFCYEPKLGQPVGACRMCLVEIEGIPKLQTGCSTPVKDGMVVHTQTERVHAAQRAVVEFLLINHPLDCPVCDKGGECPLQDITYGWGPGTSRFIEPKRHFRKPLELSPLIAIDRERCILCYRCVRFSQEISEDYQLILSERGAHSYVSTFDGHPYVAPFSGNIIELCPVGALTSTAYRFRARPWDIEGAGTICTYCPAQCNVELTVRDDRVMRVLAREHDEVDDGWLCDKGRFAYQATHVDERITQPLVREGDGAHAGELGEGARPRRERAQEGRRPRGRARGRGHDERGGLPPPAAVPRGPRLGAPRGRAGSRRVAGAVARARRPRAAGHRARPRVRARGARARLRPGRRRPDPRPADPQGRAPPPRQARGRDRAAVRARPERRDRPAHRARRRRGAARRARRGARRRRRRARRRGDGGRLERDLGALARRLARRRRRGRRDPLRRAAAGRAARRPRRAGAAQPRRAARARRPRRGRAARDPGRDERPRHPRGRLRRRARSGLRRRGGRRGRPRARVRRRRRRRPVPAARRPDLDRARPRRLGGRAAVGDDGDRPRRDAHRRARRARRRDLPRGGLRREGGDDRPSRRPAPAAPARDRAPGPARRRACAPAGRSSPTSHGARAPTSACTPDRWPRSSCSTRSRSTPG